jgi:ribosomal protein L11
MAQKVVGYVKLQILPEKRPRRPPVGPLLSARRQHHGFYKGIQRKNQKRRGFIIPVVITYIGPLFFVHNKDSPRRPFKEGLQD